MSARSQAAPPRQGPLVIIGGSEDKQGSCTILKEFVRLAGGAHAHIVVMTMATSKPAEVGVEYEQAFHRLGAKAIHIATITSREDTQGRQIARAVDHATGVFFTGGSQQRITALIGGTAIDTALHARHAEGLALAGTSAGASAMASVMIIEGSALSNPRLGIIQMAPGMEFLPGVMIDVHFAQRGRIGRLLAAVAQYPHDLGLGIDDNTAVVVEGRQFRVIGENAATVIDAGAATHSNAASVGQHESLALCGIQLHSLPHGYRFDLQARRPLLNHSEGAR